MSDTPLPQSSPADQNMDAPVARMDVRVGTCEADAQVFAAAPPWHGDENAKLSDTHEDNIWAWSVVCALNGVEKDGVAHLALHLDFKDFPKARAAQIAFGHVHGHLLRSSVPRRVTFVLGTQADADLFLRVAQARREWMGSPRR